MRRFLPPEDFKAIRLRAQEPIKSISSSNPTTEAIIAETLSIQPAHRWRLLWVGVLMEQFKDRANGLRS
jgi:hypothetical protein